MNKNNKTIRKYIVTVCLVGILATMMYSIVSADTYTTEYDSDTFDLLVDVDSYAAAIDDCTGGLTLTNPNEPTGNLRAQSGDHYGTDTCPIEVIFNDPTEKLEVQISQSGSDNINDNGTAVFDKIDNGTGDCTIDTSGNTDEEEYGYRIENVSVVSNINVETDSECSVAYNASATSPDEYLFDLELGSNKDTVLYSYGSVPYPTCFANDCTFDLKASANVAWDTPADRSYSYGELGSYFIIIDVITASP